MGQMECYERDFEEFLLKDTAEYYKRKAAAWIQVRVGLATVGVVSGGGISERLEEFLLKDTAEYYKRKAAAWIQVRGELGEVIVVILRGLIGVIKEVLVTGHRGVLKSVISAGHSLQKNPTPDCLVETEDCILQEEERLITLVTLFM